VSVARTKSGAARAKPRAAAPLPVAVSGKTDKPPQLPAPGPLGKLGRAIAWLTVEQWRWIDADCRAEAERDPRSPQNTGRYDWRVPVILVIAAISLTLQEYWGERSVYHGMFPRNPLDHYTELKGFVWWSGWRFFGYLVLPALVVVCMPGERLREYFISFKDFFKKLPIYLVLFTLVLPAVIIASRTEAFYHQYPFYKLANRSSFDFWGWEALYWLQFLSLEFFFRGFLLHGLRYSLGSKAVFVMVIPYCMIHYGKPFPETMGAIGAGLILGTLAMRTRSIWGGVMIHVAVAFTMDFLAVGHCPPPDVGPCIGR
jgi:membrane protease YdiL (CAAX protease family)